MRLRYLFFPAVFLFLSQSAVRAQTPGFEFLLKGGLNLSSLSFDNDEIPGKRIKAGGNAGVLASWQGKQNIFIQSGLLFSAKGAHIRGDAPLGFDRGVVISGKENPYLHSNQLYLQVPLLAGARLPLTPSQKLFVKAGPYFAYGIGGKTRLDAHILYGDMIDTTPLEVPTFGDRGLKKTDYGLTGAIGIDLGEVMVELGYDLGLKNIGNGSEAYIPFYHNTRYFNRNISLSVNFRL